MKATVKENETFKPIIIELVIESEQELINLYCNLNVSIRDCKLENKKYNMTDHAMPLFETVEDLMKQNGLK